MYPEVPTFEATTLKLGTTSKRVTIENYVYLQTDDFKGHFRQRSKEHGPMKSSIPIGEEL
jgi:hypothetical protein